MLEFFERRLRTNVCLLSPSGLGARKITMLLHAIELGEGTGEILLQAGRRHPVPFVFLLETDRRRGRFLELEAKTPDFALVALEEARDEPILFLDEQGPLLVGILLVPFQS